MGSPHVHVTPLTYFMRKQFFFSCEKNNSPEGIPCINCLLQSSQESASGGTIRTRILPPAPNQIDTLEHGCERTRGCRRRPMQNPACTECFLLFNFITSFFTASLETNRCGNASRALNTLALAGGWSQSDSNNHIPVILLHEQYHY